MDQQIFQNQSNVRHSLFQCQIQKLYTKTLKYFTVFFFIILVLIVAKILANYFIFSVNDAHQNIYNFDSQGTWGKIVNFMTIPEVATIQSQTYYDVHDLLSLITVLIIASTILYIAYRVEQNYLKCIKEIEEESLLFLFSLEISHLKNEQQGELFIQILDIMRPNQQICQDKTYVYDMKEYEDNKHKRLQSELAQNFQGTNQNSERELLSNKYELNQDLEKYSQFSNKMLITLNDIETIYDLLSVYHSGLLHEKIKKEKENNLETMTERNKEYFNKLEKEKGLVENLKIQLAQDPDNIIWDNYSKTRKYKVRQNFWRLFGVLILSLIFFTFAFFFQYFYAKENFRIKLFQENPKFIKIGFFEYVYSGKTIFLFFVNMVMPIIGYVIIENLMMDFQCATISSTNNYKFAVKTFFELIYRFPASHYGYRTATEHMKNLLDSEGEKIRQMFYMTHIEWIIIASSLIAGTILKFSYESLLDCLKRGWSKYKKKKNIPRKLDHTQSATNLINSVAFLGFYQILLTPSSIILANINLLIVLIVRKLRTRKTKQALYIDFNNISIVIQLALFSYAVGGLFSFDSQYVYSHRYFLKQVQNQYTFPYFVIANIVVIFILIPTLFNLTRHNSISLRILEQLLNKEAYLKQQEQLPLIIKTHSYSNSNPYEIEKKKLQEEIFKDS